MSSDLKGSSVGGKPDVGVVRKCGSEAFGMQVLRNGIAA